MINKIFELVIRQLISIYIGCAIIFIYYKIIGKNISYSEIVNEEDKDTGLKKYRYIGFYIGTFVMTIIVILIALFLK
jgi:hypothetical protein